MQTLGQDDNATQAPVGAGSSTVAILSVALAARLLVLWFVVARFPPGWLFTRGMEMGWLAKSIVDGQGLSSPFGTPTGPSAFVAPGYPLLISGIFRICGTYSFASSMVIILLQIVLNLLTIWFMMYIARCLFDQRVAAISGLVWACSLPLIWMPTIFWDTSIAICMLIGLVAFVLHFRNAMTIPRWLFLGAYCAVLALINPALLLVLIAIAGWLCYQQPRAQRSRSAVAALAFLVVFSPWPIRNARVFHAFIPLRTTVGFELWMGNRPGATGYLDESLFPSFNKRELADYKAQGELGYTAHKSEMAKEYIVGHPAIFARLTAVRVARYWMGTGAQGGSPIFALHAIVTSVLGFIGLFWLFRRHRLAAGLLFALPFLLFPLPYYITHAEFRYRLALDPMLTILAAYALVSFITPPPKPAGVEAIEEMRPVHG